MKKLRKHFNQTLFFKIPAAYFCGVRVKEIQHDYCISSVKFKWINQNPFNSIYFAVLAMAAELSTGALLLSFTQKNKQPFSTLVTGMQAKFFKKATGRINFSCTQSSIIKYHIDNAITSKKGESFILKSVGKNEQNEIVAEFEFQWSIKVKST